jgi:Gpi18-like mannosyltransferase
VFWGLANSVKLQAIFVFPVLLIAFLSGEVSFLYFFIIPAVYLTLLIPAFIAGRGFIDLLSIYVSQSDTYHCLTMNAPNVYQWLRPGCYFNEQLKQGGIILTLALVLILSLVVLRSRKKLTSVRIIRLSFLFSLLLPFFLPIMHERYFYLADVLSIAYSFYVPKRFYLAIITSLTSFLSYMPFLFGNPTIELPYVAFAPLLVIVVVVWDLIVDLYSPGIPIQATDHGVNFTGQSERLDPL